MYIFITYHVTKSQTMTDREELPDEIVREIISNTLNLRSCKEIISRFGAWIPKLSLPQLQSLTNSIQSEEFEPLRVVERITEDEGQYVPIQYYNFEPRPSDNLRQAQQDEANKFYTKCRFVDLQRRYEGDGMKAKWYNAIRTRRQGDFNAFSHFTNVTLIGGWAFYDNGLTSVIIPESVVTIGDGAFRNNQLTSVTIPESARFLGSSVFMNNELTSVTIPEGVVTIGGRAFYDNELTSVIIAEGVVTIGAWAFYENLLDEVTIPNGVQVIGDGAFVDNRLTSVTIPESVVTIGDRAFIDNQLRLVTIPESVTLGEGAFDDDVEIVRRGATDSGLGKRKRELLHKELQRIAIKF